MRRRLRGLSEGDWRTLDRVLVAGFFVAAEINVVTLDEREGPLLAAMGLAGLAALSFLWRRRQPLVPVVVVAACSVASSLLWTPATEITALAVSMIFASYSVGAHSEGRRAWFGLGCVVVLVGGHSVAFTPTDIAFPVGVFAVLPWVAGRTLRAKKLLVRELAEKAELAEHAREAEERRAVAAERARVARELHDVLAHNLSVMVIQAAAARRVADEEPEAAAEAAALIARTGRETLGELRYLFGPVRHGEGEALGASPGLDRLEGLVASARAAGLPVDLRVEAPPPAGLPAGVDATAFRLVQEALTNSLKHGRSGAATVDVHCEGWELVLEVLDTGSANGDRSAGAADIDGAGQGLVGMRERVAMYGGRMEAGPRDNGGFAVRARLPLGKGALV